MRNASHPEPESGSEALKAIYPNASRAGASSVANDCVHGAHSKRCLKIGDSLPPESRRLLWRHQRVVTVFAPHKQAREPAGRSNLHLNMMPLAVVHKIRRLVAN